MSIIDKVSVFRKELDWIVDPKIKAFGEALVNCAPDYFFECAASSTSKYHPPYALGPGGLVRHSKAAACFLHELLSNLEMFGKYSQEKKDMMLVAIIAHDFFKHGLPEKASKYTVATHPTVCRDFILENKELCSMLEPEQVTFIAECIAKHMGAFCTDYKTGKKILPKPETGPENLVHLADYVASRRYLVFDFGDDYYTPESAAPSDEPSVDPELEVVKAEIVAKCTAKIQSGIKNTAIYALIAAENDGNRNPNSIKSMAVAQNILKKLEELNA